MFAAIVAGIAGSPSARAAGPQPEAAYTIGNYPVEATAGDAVAAKDKAMQDGQQAAFRSLLKRLVPIRAYSALTKIPTVKAGDLIDGMAVRQERNSSTQYIASLDFTFRAASVRDILRAQGIPFVDTQAPESVVLPVALGDSPAEQAKLQKVWLSAWRQVDGPHALAPFKLETLKGDITPASLKPLATGEGSLLDRLATTYGNARILVAFAEEGGGQLVVTLAGQDAVGPILLRRAYKIAGGDVDYAAELASVIATGVLEGRWKAIKVESAGGIAALSQPPSQVQVFVQYANLQQWQDMRRRLSELPGVEDLQVGGVTARGADIAFRFPGGGEAFANEVGALGFDVRASGGAWILRAQGG